MEWLARKKRKQKCKVHFDEDSFHVEEALLAPVHLMDNESSSNQEYDFYLQTSYDTYLLRLINCEEKSVSICPANKGGIIYIVCHLPIHKDRLSSTIQTVLHQLKPYGFPKLANPKETITITLPS